MPRYAPLPIVSIDPRNESELAQKAAQVVYEASNNTLNDFSAGNPLAVLIEGQAFAQGELLFWANQLPEKILIEWIGPFLGAMRRLGTPAVAELTFTVSPSQNPTFIPRGTSFTTNSSLTGGQSYEFVSYSDLTIPAGSTEAKLPVYSRFVGSVYNVGSNTITGFTSPAGSIISVTNEKPAAGGSEVETYNQVKERFFAQLRRKNPVSKSDWEDFFTDLYGLGTFVSVQPNQSSKFSYRYSTDYSSPNGQVSFFVLKPGGIELTEEDLKAGQNALNFSVPIENQAHLHSISLSEVQVNLTMELDPNGSYGRDFRQSSLSFRNNLFSVLQPGNVFPPTFNPTVSDIDSALQSSIPQGSRYLDPHIVESVAYNIPNSLSPSLATYTHIYEFAPTTSLLSEKDLVREDNPNPTFYPVLTNFTPYSSLKFDQALYGNIKLTQIKDALSGEFKLGDVVIYRGDLQPGLQGLHVVLENVTVLSQSEFVSAVGSGKISEVKSYSIWQEGNQYQYTDINGVINPQIISYDYEQGEFIPSTPSELPQNQRPGSLVWVVAKNFNLEVSTNNITGARAENKLDDPVLVSTLTKGDNYTAGTWVKTAQVGSGPDSKADPNYHYVDITQGVVVKYAYVNSDFTYSPDTLTTSEYFDSLVESGTIREIVSHENKGGLPIYKYKSRFKTGQYLEYREHADSPPGYYIATNHFTPNSTNIQELESQGLVINLAPTPDLYDQFSNELQSGFSGRIGKLTINYGGENYQDGYYADAPLEGGEGVEATADIAVINGSVSYLTIKDKGYGYKTGDVLTVQNSFLGGTGENISIKVAYIEPPSDNSLVKPVRMFTFFRGDKTFFRNSDQVQAYTATTSVTPLFDFEVYYQNKIFIETDETVNFNGSESKYIPFYNPLYVDYAEDTVVDSSGKNFFRVMKSFTPLPQVVDWTGVTRSNSARFEEYSGNLLKYVVSYKCEETILPQFGQETSSLKLGNCQITIVPKSQSSQANKNQKLLYIWEKTESLSDIPELSWYSGGNSPLSPPDYKNGTLSL